MTLAEELIDAAEPDTDVGCADMCEAHRHLVRRAAHALTKAENVCRAMMAIRSAESLSLALASTDVPEDVAAVLLALTEWMDSAGLVEMEKRTITFSAKGNIYSLLTEDDTDRMKGEIFKIVADNLKAPTTYVRDGEAAAIMVESIGAYYIAKLPAAAPAPSEGADVEGDADTEPPP